MKKCQDNEGGDQGIFRYVQFNMLVSLRVLLHQCQSSFYAQVSLKSITFKSHLLFSSLTSEDSKV